MSSYTIEKVLWDLVGQPALAERFRSDIEPFLDGYPLEPTERALVALRINPMLLMRAFQCVYGRDKRPEYLRRLATPATGE
jgi:hypothetical protein